MAIIKQYHKDTDTTYVYESISYWDAEKGQSRSKRKVIGKLDPVTGEIIPTGKKGPEKKKKEEPVSYEKEEYEKKISELTLEVTKQNDEIIRLRRKNEQLQSDITKLEASLKRCLALIENHQ